LPLSVQKPNGNNIGRFPLYIVIKTTNLLIFYLNTENPFGGMFGQPAGATIAAAPAFIETSQEVIVDTVIPSTIFKEIKITFRNSPTTTTLTSVTMVSTKVTSYVTKTVRAQPTAQFNPFAAFG
jgi:hypothetical protein